MARAAAATAPARATVPARTPAPPAYVPRRRSARTLKRLPKPPVPRGAAVLDALLYGRAWIALVFVLLAGIVFFNVDLLRMNREIAVTAERASAVKRENQRLRTDLARLGSSERIQRVAAARGLVLPAPGEVRYLRSDPSVDARRAAAQLASVRCSPDENVGAVLARSTIGLRSSRGRSGCAPPAEARETGGPAVPAAQDGAPGAPAAQAGVPGAAQAPAPAPQAGAPVAQAGVQPQE